MSNAPDRIAVGPPGGRTAYRLAEAHHLVRLRPGASDAIDSGTFNSTGSAAGDVPPYIAAARLTLEPAGYAWVEAPDGFAGADDAEAALGARDEVDEVLPIYFAEDAGPESAATPITDTITVLATEGADGTAVIEAVEALGLRHDAAASRALAPHLVFHPPAGTATAEAFALLEGAAAVEGVEIAEFDWLQLCTYDAAPDDTHFADQWNLAAISLAAGRDVATGSPDVWIAVIDSGFDLTHPDLSYTPNTTANPTHGDADAIIAGNPTPHDASSVGVFHGTACAGIAGATTDNATGVAGVGGGCRIMPVSLGTVPTAARVTAGLNWAAANGARVASLSLGTVATAALNTAVTNAWNGGMVICAATGNAGANTTSPPIGFPASHANVIAVGASDRDDQRKRPASSDGETWGSQFDAGTDLVAPGVNIWTTDEQGARGYTANGGPTTAGGASYPASGDATGDYYSLFNGTSAATPHVAGLAGLIVSADPTLGNAEVRRHIQSTCEKVSPALYAYATVPGRPDGTWHQEVGYGRIDVRAAVCSAIRSVEPTTPSITFGDVPEGELALRAATFSVRSCEAITLEITAGPTVTSGPGTFDAFLGATTETVAAAPGGAVGQLWLSFVGQAPGTATAGEVQVTCVETGESWTLAMTASSVTPASSAVVMVLDQSGSMSGDAGDGRQRIDVLRDAAPILPTLLSDGDAVGVVAFDADAFAHQAVIDVSAGGALGAGGQIAGHTPNPAGRTSIGDGVALARTMLDDPTVTQQHKAMVVLTDGRENEPISLAAASAAIGDRVFGIGLGAPEHLDPAALTALTAGTGGYTLVTGTLDQDDHFTLQKYYLQILAGVTNAEVVLDPDGFVPPGDRQVTSFELTERDTAVDVVVLTPAPEALRPELVTPAGAVIDPASVASAGGRYVVGHGFVAFRLPLPAVIAGTGVHEGTWQVALDVDPGRFERHLEVLRRDQRDRELELAGALGLRYSTNVQVRSGVRMSVETVGSDHRPGSTTEIVTRLSESGRPLSGATAVVELVWPDGRSDTQPMAAIGDELRLAVSAHDVGVIRGRVLARGQTFRGSPVTREHLVTIPVWDPDRLAPDPDPPRRHEGPHARGACATGLGALLEVLREPAPTAAAVAEALADRGHDHREVLECLAGAIKASQPVDRLRSPVTGLRDLVDIGPLRGALRRYVTPRLGR